LRLKPPLVKILGVPLDSNFDQTPPVDTPILPNQAAIADLEKKATELERELFALRQVIAGLRMVERSGYNLIAEHGEYRLTPRPRFVVVQPAAADGHATASVTLEKVSPTNGRGSTTGLILDYVALHDNLPTSDIADALEKRITSPARDPRKLVLTTIGYLVKAGKLRKNADGRVTLIRQDRP
jgi:hypothetical protein